MKLIKSLLLTSSVILLITACTTTGGGEPTLDEVTAEPTAEMTEPPLPDEATQELPPAPTEAPTEVETDAPSEDGDLTSVDGFKIAVLKALNDRDLELIALLMFDDKFITGYWQSEGIEQSPIEAASSVLNYYTEDATIAIPDPQPADLSALLMGSPAEDMFGPDMTPAAIWYSTGWGTEESGGSAGSGEALLYIVLQDDGTYAWYAMLYAPMGFVQE
jgi:hypothetical protein